MLKFVWLSAVSANMVPTLKSNSGRKMKTENLQKDKTNRTNFIEKPLYLK